ncbi:MAG: GyrI-like domain-containing protein [Solirubrobacteraceae bacterium]
MPPDVALRTVAPRPTAVVSQTTTWKQFRSVWRPLLDEVYGFVRRRPELAPDEGPELWRNAFLYLDDKPTVEIGVLVARGFEQHGRVVASRLPGGDVATAVHRGDYAEMGRTHSAVTEFIAANGLDRVGPSWEIYGHWREDPSELETEIYYLVQRPT